LPGVEPAPDLLFGPRAVAFDPAGERLVVADTGNKRLVVLSRAGELVSEIATPGSELGGFAEPIGLAFRASDGALLVADTWNQRVLEADATFTRWRVAASPLWPRKTGATTPYLGVDSTGELLLSDPDRDRLISVQSGPEPSLASIFARSGELSLSDPVGVAVSANDRIWVTSRRDGQVLRLPPPGSCRDR
jgi:DNA-binding beta-propeller fold protein YncE